MVCSHVSIIKLFLSIHKRMYINKVQTNNLLHNTTKIIPGVAKYYEYPLGLKILL